MARAAQKSMSRRASIGARRNPESEAAVLKAARELLAERGYAGFSIEEVARRAGAGKPTIYRWWPSKAELFVALYQADKDAALEIPDTGTLAGDLRAYTEALWRFWRASPSGSAFRALIAEAQASSAAMEALRTKFMPERMRHVRAIFERAVARGEIAAERAGTVMDLYIGFNWFRLLSGDAPAPRAIAGMAEAIARAAM